MSDPETLIDVRHVRKSFGPKVIYDDLSLAIRKGEVITVMGGSGTGKSVLLKMILGLLEPSAGGVYFEGKKVTDMDNVVLRAMRRRMGMVFQGAALFDSLNVFENIASPIREHFDYPEDKISEIVAEKLGLVGLEGVGALMPDELSGGMRKRVSLARAIAIEPEIIFYDEPTTGLDPSNTRRICRLILSLQKRLKVTSVVVTHDVESAFEVSDRVALIMHGRLAFLGTVDEAKSTSDAEVQAFMRGTLADDQIV